MFFENGRFRVASSALNFGLLTCLFGFSQSLFSQKNLPDSVFLKTVVVQATRANEDSPVPHNNLKTNELEAVHQAADVPFLLQTLPNVVATSDAGTGIGYTALHIRGSDPTRINVTLNGVPLNDAESQLVYWNDLPDLASSASEIQVQRGVGSSTNGAGAFGATVNFDLSKIEAQRYARFAGTLGSFGTRKFTARLGSGLVGKHLSFAGRFSQVLSDGFVQRSGANLKALHLTASYLDDRQSFQANLLVGHEITGQAWYGLPAQFLDNELYRTYNVAGTEKPGDPFDGQVDDYTQRHLLLHYRRSFGQKWLLQLNLHHTDGCGFYQEYKANQVLDEYQIPHEVGADTSDLIRRLWLDNQFVGMTFALKFSPKTAPSFLKKTSAWTLGGAANTYSGEHFGQAIWVKIFNDPEILKTYYRNDATKRDGNLFLQNESQWAGGWTSFVDLQIRAVGYHFLGFDSQQNSVQQTANLLFFNPKLGLTKVFGKWLATAFAGIGNREPNRDDYTQSTPESRPRPEQMFDLELGLRRKNARWQASANLFWMHYRDQLALTGRLNDVGAYTRTNIPDSYRAGIELEASAKPLNWLQVAGNVSFSQNRAVAFTEFLDDWDNGGQVAVEHRNTDLGFSPNTVGYGEATFLLHKKSKWELSLTPSGKYVGPQFLDNTGNAATQLRGYFVADFRLNARFEVPHGPTLRLTATVFNLFDRKYESNGWAYRFRSAGYDPRPDNLYTRLEGNSVYHQAGFFPQAGQHWACTLAVEF